MVVKISRIKLLGLAIVLVLLAASSVVLPAKAAINNVHFMQVSAHCESGYFTVQADNYHPVAYSPIQIFGLGKASAMPENISLNIVVTDPLTGAVLGQRNASVPYFGGDFSDYVNFSSLPTGTDVVFSLYWADLLGSYSAPSAPFGPSVAMADGPYMFDQKTVPYADCSQPSPIQPRPGCDLMDLTGAVMGTIASDTPLYYAPDENARVYPTTIMEQGKTVWVFGQDEAHEYYQIQVNCGTLWLPAASVTTDGEDLWNHAPLPSDVVGN